MKWFFLALIFSLLPNFFTPVYAAKLRAKRSSVPKTPGISYSSARLSRATNSVIVTFLNLNQVKSSTYTLSYQASGFSQGVVGTVVPTGQASDSRDLYFGTCSRGVCTAHYNMKNVVLLVETALSSGGVYTKRYKIKV